MIEEVGTWGEEGVTVDTIVLRRENSRVCPWDVYSATAIDPIDR